MSIGAMAFAGHAIEKRGAFLPLSGLDKRRPEDVEEVKVGRIALLERSQ